MSEESNIIMPISVKYFQLRPKTGKTKNVQNRNPLNFNNVQSNRFFKNKDNIVTNIITESKNENEKDTQSIKEQISDKNKFLKVLGEESNKEIFDFILSNEIKRMKNINDKKNKLNEINLIEQKYDDLYDWTNLFKKRK